MGYKCFIPECRSGYEDEIKKRKIEGKKNLSLFSAPKDENRLQKWIRAIPRKDRKIGRRDKVCELHFLPEQISRHFVHIIGGKEVLIDREVPTLTSDAVPTIFPNLPSYLSKNKKKRKPPVKRLPLPEKEKRDSTENGRPEVITISADEIVHQFSFNDLLTNLSQVSKPHKLWGVSSHEDFIVCVKWNLNFDPEFKCQPERQVIIDANLGVKIMYYGTEVSITPNTVIESVESLSQILIEVDQYSVCPGTKKWDSSCSVYTKPVYGPRGRPSKLCNECKRNVF